MKVWQIKIWFVANMWNLIKLYAIFSEAFRDSMHFFIYIIQFYNLLYKLQPFKLYQYQNVIEELYEL